MNPKYLKIGGAFLGVAFVMSVVKAIRDEHKKQVQIEESSDDYVARLNARTEELRALHESNRIMFAEAFEIGPKKALEVSTVNSMFFNIIAHQPLD